MNEKADARRSGVLLHACCAPCTVKCAETFTGEGTRPCLYWYNPNIHPYTEYRARLDALLQYAARLCLDCKTDGEYGLRPFIREVFPDLETRCAACYRMRIEKTAARAAEWGFAFFSTTLLASPYQNHELVRETAEECGKKHAVTFLYRDFRPLFREGQARARDMGLYMQKYCGCVFSEEERYLKRRVRAEGAAGA
ncbi:MAG: epoxyqueuosine reductase QueH [Treponema sp.]|jgi:predicted adenine nucleotide alpha hydrolase (AANH) superfamily ATPase|nr:epoxyqueuosine reductase QueH [Treponema sp.]